MGKVFPNCLRSMDSCFKGVKLLKSNSAEKFEPLRCQFYQSLHNNLLQRFSSNDLLLKACVLVKSSWPTDELKKALYGKTEVACLCKECKIDSTLADDIVLDFAFFKKTNYWTKFDGLNECTDGIVSFIC